MCNGMTSRKPPPPTPGESPFSPASASSASGGRKSNHGIDFSNIPRFLSIPVGSTLDKAASPPQLPMRSDDELGAVEALPFGDSGRSSTSLPRIPRRQESMEYDPMSMGESKESSPILPRRKLSVKNLEEWFQERSSSDLCGAPNDDGVRPAELRRHSLPLERILPNHFQYISDPDAGGTCPKMPQRCKSNRKLAVEAFIRDPARIPPGLRAKSGHL